MEKKNNGYYKAVSILSYISASLSVLMALVFIVLAVSGGSFLERLFKAFEAEDIMESGGEILEVDFKLFKSTIIGYGVSLLLVAVYTFIQATYFKKYSKLTNEQAKEYFRKCTIWTIASCVTGLIIAVLAFLGLLLVQKKQKEEFENQVYAKKEEPKENSSVDKIEKAQNQLAKLMELKNAGAITDEEFNSLREKIMKELNNL